MSFSEDVGARYSSYGWQVLEVAEGDHDLDAIDRAITQARAQTARPTLITIRTTIGFGSPNKSGSADSHGSPLGAGEVAATKKALGRDPEAHFEVSEAVRADMAEAASTGRGAREEWERRLEAYRADHPELAAELERRFKGELPSGWDAELPTFEAGSKIATRSAAGKVQNAVAARVPELFGGDADLGGSTKTVIAGGGSFEGTGGSGRNVHFGVREHAMGSICNGLDYHGGVRPFAATFFCFSDYMRPAVRIAALNGQPVIYVWTHDSIGLGEDGPTHQPVEHLMALRAMPNLHVVRPCDGNEAREAWIHALARTDGPTALVLSRQNLLVFDRAKLGVAEGLRRGAYVLADVDDPQVLIVATGSEVELAMAAQGELAAGGIRARVVSMPCWEAFADQDAAYRDQVLPPSVRARVSVEAGVTFGWSQWIGDAGVAVGVDRYGASAPGEVLLEKYGITAAGVVAAARRSLDRVG
jgi:transketolase